MRGSVNEAENPLLMESETLFQACSTKEGIEWGMLTQTQKTSPLNHDLSVFFRQDKNNSNYCEGLLRTNQLLVERTKERVVVEDEKKRELLSVSQVDLSGVKHNSILDLSVDGDRWEGDVLEGKPCGWGVEYDKENRVAYEGFRIGEWNVCYGRKYYTDISRLEYEGEWCEGLRWGEGTQYDRNGDVVFGGEWVNDKPAERVFVMDEKNNVFHNRIEELVVMSWCGNAIRWRSLDLRHLHLLKSLKVDHDCFDYVSDVRIIGLSELERVVIDDNCFTVKKWGCGDDPNRHFHLKNCPKLKSLKMGRYSFSDYTVIEIENVGALEEIEIGDLHEGSYNFYSASLNLKSMVVATQSPLDLPQLKRLIFGDGSFGSCHHLVFESNTISVSSSNRPARTAIHPNGSQCVSILPLQTRVLCYSAKFFPLTRITE